MVFPALARSIAAALIGLAFLPSASHALVIDFQDPALEVMTPIHYSSDEFSFFDGQSLAVQGYVFEIAYNGGFLSGTDATGNRSILPTSRDPRQPFSNAEAVYMYRADHGLFDLESIDFQLTSDLFDSQPPDWGQLAYVNHYGTPLRVEVRLRAGDPMTSFHFGLRGVQAVVFGVGDFFPDPDFWNAGRVVSLNFDNIAVNAVPEPSTWALMALGLAGLASLTSRKQR
jgi:hypothetical protein